MADVKPIEDAQSLTKIITDTATVYLNSINHYLNNKATSVLGYVELYGEVPDKKSSLPDFNAQPFRDFGCNLDRFKYIVSAYVPVLEGHSNKPGDIPTAINREGLTQLVSKNLGLFYTYQLDTSPEGQKEQERVIEKIVNSLLNGENELALNLPFVNELRTGAYKLPSAEQEARDRVVKGFGELGYSLMYPPIQNAFKTVENNPNDALTKSTTVLLKMIETLPRLHYLLGEDHEHNVINFNQMPGP